jgi:hypothetical protein
MVLQPGTRVTFCEEWQIRPGGRQHKGARQAGVAVICRAGDITIPALLWRSRCKLPHDGSVIDRGCHAQPLPPADVDPHIWERAEKIRHNTRIRTSPRTLRRHSPD